MLTRNFPAKQALRRERSLHRLFNQRIDAHPSQQYRIEKEIDVLSARYMTVDQARVVRTKKNRQDRAKIGR